MGYGDPGAWRKPVYYKKGSDEWGTPIDTNIFTGVNDSYNTKNPVKYLSASNELLINSDLIADNSFIDIYNLNGILICSYRVESSYQRIKLNNLSAGLYIYRFGNGADLKAGKIVVGY